MDLQTKLEVQYNAIQGIKTGNDVINNKATLMLNYIDAEVSMDAIHLFSETIDTNINLFELTSAYTWFKLGFNYLLVAPLDSEDIDLYQRIYTSYHHNEVIYQTEHFNLFKEFYSIMLEQLIQNEQEN